MNERALTRGAFALASKARARRQPDSTAGTASPFSWIFMRAYLTTMRPYLLFVSGITGVLGMALAPAISVGPAVLLCAVFFLSYGFGQALTDCFQIDTDALSSPYRPLVKGEVSRRSVLLVSLVGLGSVGGVLVASHLVNLALVSLAVAGLLSYTWFKRRWWGGPFYNAWIVALLVVIAHASASGHARIALAWPRGMSAAVLVSLFAYANFVLAGYFKDLSADRATGYHTFPVVFGLRVAAYASDVLAAAALVFAAMALQTAGVFTQLHRPLLPVLFLVAGAIVSIVAQLRLHQVTGESEAHRSISLVVHAYILTLSALASAFRPQWGLALVLFYAAFCLTLRLRPVTEQI